MGNAKEIRQDEGMSMLRNAPGESSESSSSSDGKEGKKKEQAKKPKREEIVE